MAEENTGRSSPGSSHDLSNHEDIRSEFTKKKKGRATPTCQSSKASEAAAGFQGAGALAALRQGRGRSRKAAPQTTWAPTRPGALGGSCWGVMAGSVQGSGSRALDLLRTLPRVSLANLKPNPGSRKLVSGWWRCGQALAHGAMEAALHCPRFPGTAYSRGYWDGGRVSESLFSLTAEENLLAWCQLVIRFMLKSIIMLGRRSEVALQNDCPVQNWN